MPAGALTTHAGSAWKSVTREAPAFGLVQIQHLRTSKPRDPDPDPLSRVTPEHYGNGQDERQEGDNESGDEGQSERDLQQDHDDESHDQTDECG